MNEKVTTVEALQALYPAPSSKAMLKRVSHLNDALREKISTSSLCVIASSGTNGVDCSPRGDAPGHLVKVLDDHTLAIPDRAGSHRLDTAKNVIDNGAVGVWFLSNQWQESVRVSGDAHISTDSELLKLFELNGELPVTVLVISIQHVAIHNDRAIRSSGLMP